MGKGAASPPIDLLDWPSRPSPGIDRSNGEFTVRQPWAGLELAPLTLPAGWYRLRADGEDCAVCLQLFDARDHTLIELSASDDAPAFVRLDGGRYGARLIVGPRCGVYAMTHLGLAAMSASERMRLFASRAVATLRAGVGPARLYAALRRALRPRGTFGVRARPSAGAYIGPLTRNDFARMTSGRHRFLPAAPDGPVFLVRPIRAGDPVEGLEAQSYRRFTLDPTQPHDAICYVDSGERLTPDALAAFADILVAQPDISVVIADTWVNGRPTTRVAFDPLLYRDGYPTPHAIRTGFTAEGPWASQQPRFGTTSVPLSFRDFVVPVSGGLPPFSQNLRVTIIIPTRDRADLLRVALAGLFEATDWPHTVVVVDNGSVEPETFALFDEYRPRGLNVVRADMPFNFSALCNLGAQSSQDRYLVFMNNDVELIRPDWLAHMMRLATLDDVGAVGGRLLYADKRLQHGGVAIGLTQVCGHPWRGLPFEAQKMVDRLCCDSLRAAVTGALLCVSRARFDAVGGFDETAFPVTLNDVDLCLKLRSRGWFSAYAADAEAYHHEGESRGEDTDPEKKTRRQAELDAFVAKWPDMLAADPWLPLAVSRATERFDLR